MAGIFVPWLADAARLTGYPVVELAGWQARGHGGFRAVEVVVAHHTAGAPLGDYPSLGVVRDGRAGLDGPLANYGLGRSGTVYVVAAGVAWHAGASAWAGFYDLNDEAIGIEAESVGTRDDWTWEQRDAYPRLVAATLHYMGRGAERACGHRECALPAGRKIDPAFWNLPALRGEVARYLADPALITRRDDDMDAAQDLRLRRVEKAVEVILQQICGEGSTIENPWPAAGAGWSTDRYGPSQERLTLIMFLQRIDRQLNSALDLAGRPAGDFDNDWGHLLSLRAEVRDLAARVAALRPPP